VAAACGDTGPTAAPTGASRTPDAAASGAPDGSTAPSVSPSPPPADVAALAAAAIANPSLKATVKLDGTTKLGRTTTSTKGSIDIDGRASHLVRTDKTGKTSVKTETLTGNGTRYAKLKGVWTRAGESDDTELIAMLRSIGGMTDLGLEDKDGTQLHHLQATDVPAVPRELAVASKGVSNLSSTLDAWVTEDGTPVSMTLTSAWDQEVDGSTVKGTKAVDFEFTNVGGDVTVAVPNDIWKFFTSKRYRYRMAYPETFTAKAGKGRFADSFDGGEEYVYASRARQTNANLAFLTRGILDDLKAITGYKDIKITSNKKARLDGVPARRIEFRGKSSGDTVYGQAVYAIKGAFWYFVGLDTFAKWNKDSRGMFTTFIRTFDFR